MALNSKCVHCGSYQELQTNCQNCKLSNPFDIEKSIQFFKKKFELYNICYFILFLFWIIAMLVASVVFWYDFGSPFGMQILAAIFITIVVYPATLLIVSIPFIWVGEKIDRKSIVKIKNHSQNIKNTILWDKEKSAEENWMMFQSFAKIKITHKAKILRKEIENQLSQS